jgi:putative ABC transport system permease protein
LRGRLFTEHDTHTSTPVVIVNAAFAKKYFPKENAVGKTIEIGKGIGPDFADSPREIVGVIGNVRETGLANGEVPVMYIPQCQQQDGLTKLASNVIPMAWEVRSSLNDKQLTAAVTKAIQAIDGQMPVAEVKSMDHILQNSLSRQNFNMLLLSIFAGSALLLAAIGIYGLMSYAVQQQTQELGVRIALGADKAAVVRLVLRQGMTPALIGVAIGLGVAFGVTRLMEGLLYGVKAADPLSFFGVAAILTAVALLAVLIPARRAMGVDPLVALRSE